MTKKLGKSRKQLLFYEKRPVLQNYCAKHLCCLTIQTSKGKQLSFAGVFTFGKMTKNCGCDLKVNLMARNGLAIQLDKVICVRIIIKFCSPLVISENHLNRKEACSDIVCLIYGASDYSVLLGGCKARKAT